MVSHICLSISPQLYLVDLSLIIYVVLYMPLSRE